jgi:hypothetical protein
MSADLTAATASYRSLLIELRDDISRARQHTDIVSLATVMGPAVTAGMLEPVSFEAGLQGDSVLTKLIEEQSAAVYSRLTELFQAHEKAVRISTLADVTKLLDDDFIQLQISLGNKVDITLNKLEAKSRELLNEAEAKANIISRKRADILSVFEAQIVFVTDQSRRILGFNQRLEGLTLELQAHCENIMLSSDEVCSKISKISAAQKAFESQKEMSLKTIMAHFGEAMTLGRSKNSELVALTIPENIEAGKGAALMENLTMYLAGRADTYYALMPYIQRVISDYDPITGRCYKPPDLVDEIATIPEEIRAIYVTQAKSLYNTLTSKLTTGVKRLIKSTFQYGLQEETALCSENDGPTALFALICMFRPCTLEHTEKIESALYEAHKGFKTGNIRKHIKAMRSFLLEAQDLSIELKWKQSGKQIVDVMTHKDHNMNDALKDYKNIVVSDKTCTAVLDRLFAAIESQCKRDEKHDDKHGSVEKHANSADGKGSGNSKPAAGDTSWRSTVLCRDAASCTNKTCGFKHPHKSGGDQGSKGGKGKGLGGKGGTDSTKKKCQGPGCSEKLEASDYKMLCQPCFNKAKELGSMKLKNGEIFTNRAVRKASAAIAAAGGDGSDSDEEDHDLPAGPKSHKRKVQLQLEDDRKSKKGKGYSQEVKAFALKMGMKLN